MHTAAERKQELIQDKYVRRKEIEYLDRNGGAIRFDANAIKKEDDGTRKRRARFEQDYLKEAATVAAAKAAKVAVAAAKAAKAAAKAEQETEGKGEKKEEVGAVVERAMQAERQTDAKRDRTGKLTLADVGIRYNVELSRYTWAGGGDAESTKGHRTSSLAGAGGRHDGTSLSRYVLRIRSSLLFSVPRW